MTVPIPDEAAQRKRIALVAAGTVLALVLVAAGAWAVMRPKSNDGSARTFTPAEETTASGPATSSAVASALAGDGTTGSATTGAGAGHAGDTLRVAKIVFHLGRSLYVANEDGSGAVAMSVPESEYALSPDGESLAVVRGGKLVVMAVGSDKQVVAGAAERVAPVWMPDSSAVLFVRAGADGVPAVWKVRRDGTLAAAVGAGQGAAVSDDGSTIALLPSEADADAPQVTVVSAGRVAKTVSVSGGDPVAVAVSGTWLFVSTLSPQGKTAIWMSGLDGSGRRELVSTLSTEGKAATYGRLILSPDGRSLAYTADGDDGYSRVWVVAVAGGSPRQVTSRRDGYPLGWTADGSAIVFFEGNSFQGESSALWRSDPDGMHRRMIVSGAIQ